MKQWHNSINIINTSTYCCLCPCPPASDSPITFSTSDPKARPRVKPVPVWYLYMLGGGEEWVGVRRAGLVWWHNNNRIDMSHIGTRIQIEVWKNIKSYLNVPSDRGMTSDSIWCVHPPVYVPVSYDVWCVLWNQGVRVRGRSGCVEQSVERHTKRTSTLQYPLLIRRG